MKKISKRVLAILLVAFMLTGMVPAGAFAAGETPVALTDENVALCAYEPNDLIDLELPIYGDELPEIFLPWSYADGIFTPNYDKDDEEAFAFMTYYFNGKGSVSFQLDIEWADFYDFPFVIVDGTYFDLYDDLDPETRWLLFYEEDDESAFSDVSESYNVLFETDDFHYVTFGFINDDDAGNVVKISNLTFTGASDDLNAPTLNWSYTTSTGTTTTSAPLSYAYGAVNKLDLVFETENGYQYIVFDDGTKATPSTNGSIATVSCNPKGAHDISVVSMAAGKISKIASLQSSIDGYDESVFGLTKIADGPKNREGSNYGDTDFSSLSFWNLNGFVNAGEDLNEQFPDFKYDKSNAFSLDAKTGQATHNNYTYYRFTSDCSVGEMCVIAVTSKELCEIELYCKAGGVLLTHLLITL